MTTRITGNVAVESSLYYFYVDYTYVISIRLNIDQFFLMHTFVTIGSTRFDLLIKEILSPHTLEALKSRRCTTLTVQCGNSAFEQASLIAKGETVNLSIEGIQVELWKFKPALIKEYEKADLVISHAG